MKTILITGSTDGIGKLTAIKLANEGHHIYIHGRNPEKLAAAISKIKAQTGNENIFGFVADFSDLNAVKAMAEKIKDGLDKIDVLINNAGVFKSPVNEAKAGLDIRFAVNYFAPYILTNGLLPLLKNSTETRVVNLSSAAQGKVTKGALLGKVKIPVSEAYAQSKLALTMWSFRLAQEQSDISVIAVNPGSLLNTNMVKEAYGHHWSSADKGASILHDLVVSPNYKGISGKYFDNDRGQFGNAHPDAYDENLISLLIDETEKVIAN